MFCGISNAKSPFIRCKETQEAGYLPALYLQDQKRKAILGEMQAPAVAEGHTEKPEDLSAPEENTAGAALPDPTLCPAWKAGSHLEKAAREYDNTGAPGIPKGAEDIFAAGWKREDLSPAPPG